MKTSWLILILILLPFYADANMASPYIRETQSGGLQGCSQIDVTHESLNITILTLDSAFFEVIYTVYTETDMKRVPLLFDTMHNVNDFKVWLDDIIVPTRSFMANSNNENRNIPMDSLVTDNFSDKALYLENTYFEVDLDKGSHQIKIEYVAESSIFLGGRVIEYYFSYNLAPIKKWKSFGKLDLKIDAREYPDVFNLVYGDSIIKVGSDFHMTFDSIPSDKLRIKSDLSPKGGLTKLLIVLQDNGILFIITASILEFLLIWWVLRYREKHPLKKISIPVLLGTIFVPFLWLSSVLFSFTLIDDLIGEYASRRHGYIFLIFLAYPVLVIVQFIIVFSIDFLKKKTITKNGI